MTLNLILLASVFITALISGAISLGGGTILMGIFGWVFPVSVAMILHGITQFCSNIGRALLYRRYIHWRCLGYYFIGAVFCTATLAGFTFVPNKVLLFVLLGLMPFINIIVPRGHSLDISRPSHSVACGVLVSVSLLIAGVAGPILDVFYVRAKLNRFQIIATKGITQTVGHATKIIYFAYFLELLEDVEFPLPIWVVALMIILVFAGIYFTRQIVHAISDDTFQRWTMWLTMTIGVLFLWRGVTLWLG